MQDAALEHWRLQAEGSGDDPPAPLGDFGFINEPDDALEIGWVFKNYNILPDDWRRQTEADRHDILLYLRGQGWAEWRAMNKDKPTQKATSDEDEFFIEENDEIPGIDGYA